MKAAICRSFNEALTVEEVILAAPRPGEVEVTLAACAICHSDIHYIEGVWGGTLPVVLGHEAAGYVSSIGSGVHGVETGQPVLVTLLRSCGRCACCAAGRPTICEAPHGPGSPLSLPDGSPVGQGLETGAFAEKVVVDQSQIMPLPGDIALDVASVMSCAVITGTGAVFNSAKMPVGATALVIGAGGVGLNAIQAARIAGARRVVAMDIVPEKLEAAREFGATDTIRAGAADPRAELRAITGKRGADYVFVTVGAISVFERALAYCVPGGTVVWAGMPGDDDEMRIRPIGPTYKEQRIVGSRMGSTVLSRDIPRLIDYYRQGRLKLDELISDRYRLDEINAAIADSKSGGARRNVILFDAFER